MIDESRTLVPGPAFSRGDTSGAPGPATPLLTGHLAGVAGDGRLRFDDGTHVYPVDIGVETDDGALVHAARTGRAALVAETARGPLLVALVRERLAPDALTGGKDGEDETLTLRATRRVEIVCGKARIVLEKDGRVHVQGTSLLSSATGPIRIKGATVALN